MPGARKPRQPSRGLSRYGRGCHGFLAWRGMNQNDTPSLFQLTFFARRMRKRPTRSEALLWAQLRRGKLGVRFRRQHPMLGFIVDFYCASARLVVEVDGSVHDSFEARRHDTARDAWLARFA